MAVCKGCGAEIKWIETEQGRVAPVDAVPEKRYIISRQTDRGILVNTYMPHFATCSEADRFRKKKRGGTDGE